jgi:hypothetical protein
MNNRITGDFDADTIEAFRAAYAASMNSPEEHDIDPVSQMPTNVISNTSPWIEHTGLWKANDGMSRDFKPNQPFNPDDYFPADDSELTEDSEVIFDNELPELLDDGDQEEREVMTEEQFQTLSEEIWDEDEESSEPYYEGEGGDEDEDKEDDELEEGEIEELINEILGYKTPDEDEDSYDTDE